MLDGVSFTLEPRRVLALCGRSGCGKSTLVKVIAGLVPFDAGMLRIGEAGVRSDRPYPSALYGQVGVVFQEHNLFPHKTALENVTLGLLETRKMARAEACERGMAELERMGVADIASRYPATFSGGERQRVAIARALAMDPLLLLLDEPTANLDPDRVDEVCDRIVELADSGTTMLLVTHQVDFAREAASRFALMQEGALTVSEDPAVLDALRRRR